MQRRYSKTLLAQAQDDLWLAEIEREDESTLVITLAGPGRIVALECSGLSALALGYESLDPEILPKDLKIDDALELSQTTEFDSDDEIPARLCEIDLEQAEDILSASKHHWLVGNDASLNDATLILDLRVESWKLNPHPTDLHLLIVAESLLVADEDSEISIKKSDEQESQPQFSLAKPYAAPDEPAFEVAEGDFPDDVHALLQRFFTAGLANDFQTLATIVQNFDLSDEQQEAYFGEHFHSLFDWYYARAFESFDRDGDLACARVRGIIHSREEDGIQAINEECVWSFSLRQKDASWIIRNWSTSWPSVGGVKHLEEHEKPWLSRWQSGPIS